MSRVPSNIPASIRHRLRNKAREEGRTPDELLQLFAMERFLYRLGCSKHRERFVLKGALALLTWNAEQTRTTRDIDLLGFAENSPENMGQIVAEVCGTAVEAEDGLVFDPATIRAVRIKEGAEYEGVRITFTGLLGETRIPMHIDIGFNDVVTPRPEPLDYPVLLDHPAPQLKGYTRESVIAEKLEAMEKLGTLNSRMKDFYDIWMLAGHFRFDQHELGTAVRATFQRRGTPMGVIPAILTPDFGQLAEKQKQWSAFLAKSSLKQAPVQFREVTTLIAAFVAPILTAQTTTAGNGVVWDPPGPWRAASTQGER